LRSGTTAVLSGVVRGGANSVAGGTTLGVRIGGVPGGVCADAGVAQVASRQAQRPSIESDLRQLSRVTADQTIRAAAGLTLSVTLPILASVLI
jgi:hypothetical protein